MKIFDPLLVEKVTVTSHLSPLDPPLNTLSNVLLEYKWGSCTSLSELYCCFQSQFWCSSRSRPYLEVRTEFYSVPPVFLFIYVVDKFICIRRRSFPRIITLSVKETYQSFDKGFFHQSTLLRRPLLGPSSLLPEKPKSSLYPRRVMSWVTSNLPNRCPVQVKFYSFVFDVSPI